VAGAAARPARGRRRGRAGGGGGLGGALRRRRPGPACPVHRGALTAAEERELLPLVADRLPATAWTAVRRAARSALSGRERLLLLGLALEDAAPAERARLLAGVGRGWRLVWRLVGRRRHRVAVVRLRGAPPPA
jgi:hypothetical protein